MSATGIEIVRVRDEADAEEVRALARALRAWNYEFMPDLTSVIDAYFTSHDFEGHLERLLTVCNPPDGECLLARLDGAPVGAVTLQRRTATEAEVNRLFVRDGGTRGRRWPRPGDDPHRARPRARLSRRCF